MIALIIFGIGFIVAWKMSLRATLRGAGLLFLALVLLGIFLWAGQMQTTQDVDLTYALPEDSPGLWTNLSPIATVLVGFVTGTAVVSFVAYGFGALLGRLTLKLKKIET